MATRLAPILLGVILCMAGANLLHFEGFALAAELDEKGEAQAKEATRLYKQGQYEEAAKVFAQLSVEHPDMPIFERNMGACFYYLKKPEPALSNLRNYLNHKKDITPDDKSVVERWIEEMEKLRAQSAAPGAQPMAPADMEPQSSKTTGAGSPTSAHEGTGAAQQPAPAVPPVAAPLAPTPTEQAVSLAGVDLASPPEPSEHGEGSTPFYKRWWFWGTVGAVVAAGTVTAIILSTGKGGSNVPETALGNQGAF